MLARPSSNLNKKELGGGGGAFFFFPSNKEFLIVSSWG